MSGPPRRRSHRCSRLALHPSRRNTTTCSARLPSRMSVSMSPSWRRRGRAGRWHRWGRWRRDAAAIPSRAAMVGATFTTRVALAAGPAGAPRAGGDEGCSRLHRARGTRVDPGGRPRDVPRCGWPGGRGREERRRTARSSPNACGYAFAVRSGKRFSCSTSWPRNRSVDLIRQRIAALDLQRS